MVDKIYYGDISEARQKEWNSEDDNPYKVLGENMSSISCDWMEFFDFAKNHFSNEIQVDWGSFAYKCSGKELLKLERSCCASVENSNEIQPEKEYGVVFIEMV